MHKEAARQEASPQIMRYSIRIAAGPQTAKHATGIVAGPQTHHRFRRARQAAAEKRTRRDTTKAPIVPMKGERANQSATKAKNASTNVMAQQSLDLATINARIKTM